MKIHPFRSLKALRTQKTILIPMLAQEIVEDFEAALEQYREIVADLSGNRLANSQEKDIAICQSRLTNNLTYT
jgi:hypothetical protein